MCNISSRIYENDQDFRILPDLIARVRPRDHLNDYPGKVDIEENLMSAAVRMNTRLWFDEDLPVAWAYVDEFSNLRWEVDRQHEQMIGTEIVAWGESCIRKTLTNGEAGVLDTNCREDYVERISFLKKHGFSQTEATTVVMIRPLDTSIPDPELPRGFVIRLLSGTVEAEAVARVHRAAFGTEYMTTENRLAIMNTSQYEPALDLVVVSPDGTIAANCICSTDQREKIGNTDPVLAHPRFQRMGLSRALLLTGLRLLKERGMTVAQLGTRGENIAMLQTAKSAGFTIEHKTLWFSKKVK